MASVELYQEFAKRYWRGNMPPEMIKDMHKDLMREMQSRISGNYPTSPALDNDMLVTIWGLACPFTPQAVRQRFREESFPKIRNAEFVFHRVDDFVNFHLRFAEMYRNIKSSFRLEAEHLGNHENCYDDAVGRSRGCDICELVIMLESHLGSLPVAIGENGMSVTDSFGAIFTIRGVVKERRMKRMQVEGPVHQLPWRKSYEVNGTASKGWKQVSEESPAAPEVKTPTSPAMTRSGQPDEEPQLMCCHEVGRKGIKHCVGELGCWEIAV